MVSTTGDVSIPINLSGFNIVVDIHYALRLKPQTIFCLLRVVFSIWPVVSTIGNVSMSINLSGCNIVLDIHYFPAVETAGYVLPFVCGILIYSIVLITGDGLLNIHLFPNPCNFTNSSNSSCPFFFR